MIKKSKKVKEITKVDKRIEEKKDDLKELNIPAEAKEKIDKIKKQLDIFKKNVMEKFDKYIIGIGLLPPEMHPKLPHEGKDGGKEEKLEEAPAVSASSVSKENKDKINILVLVDDSDSKKMPKYELKTKLIAIIKKIAEDIDKNFTTDVIILSELWQSLYDGKSTMVKVVSAAAPIYDKGMLAAIKIAEIHKNMVLKKFEKYIVSYVLSGSLLRGEATKESDIDVFVVIDDTDVKKMTRAELKDKLRAIIIGMGIEAGEMTGVKNKLNIQVYILTDFWESLKEANPIIFTLLRDGVPFYDRGIFMPWKQLLKMGKIKPSTEAIELFMSSGEKMLERTKDKIKYMGMEDTYYSILTPSQAALMLFGVPPPAPRETAELMREIFVKKEKLLEEEYVKILENNIKIRKDLEHGTLKNITGKEVDKLISDAEKYLKRIKDLFTQIDEMKQKESVKYVYDSVVTITRDIMKLEGIEKVKDSEMLKLFEEEMVHRGLIPQKYLTMLNDIIEAKKEYDVGKLAKHEVEKVKKHSSDFIKFMVEYMQRKRGRSLERARIRVKHGSRYGEVLLLDDTAFIIHDIDNRDKEISKAKINADGSLGTTEPTTLEELEKHLAKFEMFPKVFVKEPLFENLRNIFGKDVEILINY